MHSMRVYLDCVRCGFAENLPEPWGPEPHSSILQRENSAESRDDVFEFRRYQIRSLAHTAHRSCMVPTLDHKSRNFQIESTEPGFFFSGKWDKQSTPDRQRRTTDITGHITHWPIGLRLKSKKKHRSWSATIEEHDMILWALSTIGPLFTTLQVVVSYSPSRFPLRSSMSRSLNFCSRSACLAGSEKTPATNRPWSSIPIDHHPQLLVVLFSLSFLAPISFLRASRAVSFSALVALKKKTPSPSRGFWV